MFSSSAVRPVVASERGALDGFESKCSCGLAMRSSLRTLIDADRAQHAAWHAKQAK